LVSVRLGADGRIMLILIGKNLGWKKFTSQKEGYPERGNEFFLDSEVGLFYKNLLYSSTKLLQLCKKCFQRRKQ
jgi:hypothetical protein